MKWCCIFIYLVPGLKTRSFILRCAAFLLMLAFSQKTGAGLFLHNLLHTETTGKPAGQDENSREISIACSCIDDFLMPLDEPAQPVVCIPPVHHHNPVFYYRDTIPFYTCAHASLRGPPAAAL